MIDTLTPDFTQSKQVQSISDRSHFMNCLIMGEKSSDSSYQDKFYSKVVHY